jgi:hypothetical protein
MYVLKERPYIFTWILRFFGAVNSTITTGTVGVLGGIKGLVAQNLVK